MEQPLNDQLIKDLTMRTQSQWLFETLPELVAPLGGTSYSRFSQEDEWEINELMRDRSPYIQSETPDEPKLFKKHSKGYHRYGGGRIDKVLMQLRDNRRLSITDAEIDMLQRIANVETGGLIQGINSYDNAFMSMGFMQWTIKYNDRYSPNGKLQRLIERAPVPFRRYGIELATTRYQIYAGKDKKTGKTLYYTPLAIKGASTPEDLRSLEWARRFYTAGLDADIIIAEVNLALEILKEDKQRIMNRVGRSFLQYYERSPILRALIHETFNNRPVYLYQALKQAIVRANTAGSVTTDQFLELVRTAIREVYRQREKEAGLKKANNLVSKTAHL